MQECFYGFQIPIDFNEWPYKYVPLHQRKMMKKVFFFILIIIGYFSHATVWNVGLNKQYNAPSKVSTLVKNGDTINIDPGVYTQDVCFWKAHHLLIRGMNGKAHLKAEGKAAGQKAIWVVQGDSTIIENIEFSECIVADKNGAGIRLEATHLVIRNCYFHNNENGILGGDNVNSDVIIENSEFAFNGYGDGQSHNLYLNHIRSLIFRYNYTHDAKVGHLFKSRAHNNYILYNRLSGEKGDGSYEIDLPNGGNTIIMGNIIQQGAQSENGGIISYGLEGLNNPTSNNLILSHNTIINERQNGTFIQLKSGTESLFLLNNVFAGNGTFLTGTPNKVEEYGTLRNNAASFFHFNDSKNLNYYLLENSPCVNTGYFSEIQFPNLTPSFQYKHPAQYEIRNIELVQDVGAFEADFLRPFVSPLNAQYKKDFIIVNYVDWINSKFQDAWCGTKSYDGHAGTDFVLDGFLSMKKGIDINAVEDGVVTSIQEGLFDEETQGIINKGFGNYICIKHKGKYYTYYAHLKKNSIKVKVGDQISQGQSIAQVGSSGNSTDPHLHFEFWWDSTTLIDPFKAPCGNVNSFWSEQFVYDTSHQIWRSGLLGGLTSLDSLRFNDYQRSEFDIDKDYYTTYWNLGYGLHKGDKYTFQWYNQVGTKVWQIEDISTSDYWYYYLWSNVDVKNLGLCENCEVRYLVNNEIKDQKFFKVRKITSIDELDISQFYYTNNSIIIPENTEIIQIVDLTGKSQNFKINNYICTINAPNGIYFLQCKRKGKILNVKFVISSL